MFLCFLAFFSVLRRNVQPFVSLAPGSVATHLSILETVPVVIGEAPSQSPTRAVGMAVGFVKESLKAIVEPQVRVWLLGENACVISRYGLM